MRRPVYMDYHSTTPVDRRVLDALLPYLTEKFGNAASRTHAYGWAAEEGVEKARQQLAAALRCRPRELVFTSGATEANNLAIKGVVEYHRDREPHVVTCATEHPSVLDSCRTLERKGLVALTVLPVDCTGRVDPEAVRGAITDRTVLVSVMAANNEIGTLQPVTEIGRITREKGVLFHTDATQAIGKVPFDVESAGADLVAFSSHKVYGPKGVGALFVRGRNPRVRLVAQMDGGGHERGLRSGTLNVPAIVGFGRAVEIAEEEREDEAKRLRALRDRLVEQLFAGLDELRVNGHPEERLPGNANVSFRFVEAESLLMALDKDVALSSGSACTSATLEPSHVLRAIGLKPDEAEGSVRFGLGRFTTAEDVEWVVGRVVREVKRLRELSPFYAAKKTKTRDRATA